MKNMHHSWPLRVFSAVVATLLLMTCSHTYAQRPNVLFIAIDDLRPELGCYGSPIAKSPNLDKLASTGLLFNRAYCQQAICSPSRASLMTGARPDTIGVIENSAYFRELNPDIVTLTQHFIAHGYDATYAGKIFHHDGVADLENSWNRKTAKPDVPKPKNQGGYALPENQKIWRDNKKILDAKYGPEIARGGLIHGPAWESADVPDHGYEDGYKTDVAIATLKQLVEEQSDAGGDARPFFLGLGLKKPHLEFIAPKKYYDMYDPADIPLAEQVDAPKNGAAMGIHPSFELRVRDGIPKEGKIDQELARKLKHAYLACVSYADAQIGRMIDALDESGVRDNTIIIVWGDHGWHLGEMGAWGKATNYEIATRVPLMIWTPDMAEGVRGQKTDALVELVDMYPTLCELAGVPLADHLEGHSFKPLLSDCEQPWKAASFSQFPNPALREWAANPLSMGMRETFFGPLIEEVEQRIIAQQGEKWDRELFEQHLMGYTMRTDQYRIVVWQDYRAPEAEPVFVELFDHASDPDETVNIAAEQPEVVKQLLAQYRAGWKGSLPPVAALVE